MSNEDRPAHVQSDQIRAVLMLGAMGDRPLGDVPDELREAFIVAFNIGLVDAYTLIVRLAEERARKAGQDPGARFEPAYLWRHRVAPTALSELEATMDAIVRPRFCLTEAGKAKIGEWLPAPAASHVEGAIPENTGEGERATKTPTEVIIPNRARKAGEQYLQTVEALGLSNPTDRQAYDQFAAAMEQSGESADLPRFGSWQRNLRTYRRLTGQQKNQPRAGRRGSTASTVRADQIEPEQLPSRIRSKRSNR